MDEDTRPIAERYPALRRAAVRLSASHTRGGGPVSVAARVADEHGLALVELSALAELRSQLYAAGERLPVDSPATTAVIDGAGRGCLSAGDVAAAVVRAERRLTHLLADLDRWQAGDVSRDWVINDTREYARAILADVEAAANAADALGRTTGA